MEQSGMSKLQQVKFDVDAIAARLGIDMTNAPTREELAERCFQRGYASYMRKQRQLPYKHSVWHGGQRQHFTFADWQVTLQADADLAAQLGNRAFRLAKQMTTQPLNVLLLGGSGVGKTALSLAMLAYLKPTHSVMFVSTTELANLLAQQYHFSDIRHQLQQIEIAMKQAQILILDDFGTEGGMRNHSAGIENINPVRKDLQELLYRVADERFNLATNQVKLSTIITTNNSQSQLEAMYHPKLISRLLPKESAHRLAFNGMHDVRRV